MNICTRCHQQIADREKGSCTTGYGEDREGNKFCYSCCAELDKEQMDKEGKITLYIDGPALNIPHKQLGWMGHYCGPIESGEHKITNWPGSLIFKPHAVTVRRHNMGWSCGVTQVYAWFNDDKGNLWLGRQVGHNNQLIHCKRLKTKK